MNIKYFDTQLQLLGIFRYHETIQSLTSRKRYAQKRLDAALVDGKISMSEETSLPLKHAEPVCRAEIYQALHLLTKFTLLLPLKETQRDSNL